MVSPEKERHCAGAGVASDRRPDIIDLDFSVEIGETLLDKSCDLPGILFACRLGDVAFSAVGCAACRVLFHLVHDGADHFLFGADFISWNQAAHMIHIEQGTDTQQSSDGTGGFGNAPSSDIEGQVR